MSDWNNSYFNPTASGQNASFKNITSKMNTQLNNDHFSDAQKVPNASKIYLTNFRQEGANNVYKNCPAKMSDGRFITRYEPANDITNALRTINGIQSTNQFRRFMQNNADVIMATERSYLEKTYSCHPNTVCSEGYYWLNRQASDGKYQKTNYTYDRSVELGGGQYGPFSPLIENPY